ncbi:hypothetical protein COO91_10464 (plasmid) [Nostoc flagelliforme CCNUN1]|uniref:Uncharacterized protein n=1 Tax=Nostoc flagelliforme CCNUN1 TaxID=2038116 RepID=A0A2K8T9A8_9NOSO|nr:hypothetical protein [Nostoc flagelliforme]AUB44241.1 hypothetical protein COO91_10464 [Nostoc flagelliforme CCNUN1]
MRVRIKESAIADFQSIHQLDKTHKRVLGNLVNLWASCTQIVNTFNQQSQLRPLLKKVGISAIIILSRLQVIVDEISYEKLIAGYIKQIGWDDLQYIAFIAYRARYIEVNIIFNRVRSSTQIIDLKCLGAKWMQYEILYKSYTDIINMADTKFYLKPGV